MVVLILCRITLPESFYRAEMPSKKKSDPEPPKSKKDEASSSTQNPTPLKVVVHKSWVEIVEDNPQLEEAFKTWLQFQQALSNPRQVQVLPSNILMSTPSSSQTLNTMPSASKSMVPYVPKQTSNFVSTNVSQYVRKIDYQNLIQIEPEWFTNNHLIVAQKILPSGFNFIPSSNQKSENFPMEARICQKQ
ncbi:hypothetical protein ACH5RR_011994 [Cinchona calisaya]|uniref:Uncharacterized protein n=1 Tax=Cinchona calisaya TaxID=153742 RepID=A0ABD3A714_9GENT